MTGQPSVVVVYADDDSAGWAVAISRALAVEGVGPLPLDAIAALEMRTPLVVVTSDPDAVVGDGSVAEFDDLVVAHPGAARTSGEFAVIADGVRVVPVSVARFDVDVDELSAALGLTGSSTGSSTWKERLGRVLRWRPMYTRAAEVLGIVTAVIAGVAFGWGLLRSDPVDTRVLEGDVTVAVAGFAVDPGAGDGAESAVEDLALSLWSEVDRDIEDRAGRVRAGASPLSADVLSPTEASPVEGSTAGGLASDVEELALRHGAQVVLTATVSSDLRVVQPIVYLSPRALPNAAEFGGLFPFGPPIEVRTPLVDSGAARAEIREALVALSASAAELSIGLARLENGFVDAAVENFESALELWPSGTDDDIVYLFIGNAQLQLEDYDEAEIAYGLGARQDGAATERIELAQLELVFHQHRGDCERVGDSVELAAARDGYAALRAEATAVQGDAFRARVDFGLARTTLCLASLGSATFTEASPHYLAVIEVHGSGLDLVRDIAAESFAGLGVIASRDGVTWDPDVCASDQGCYRRAADLAVDPARQETFEQLAG